ncbi:MAG: chemotaxis protein CheB [bacterium]|nr:chemotaxis protein CheB [bacterium]
MVGVGGSAGGLAAFSSLLENIPADTGMAFVIVQHLAPTSKSSLGKILSGITSLPVTEAKSGIPIEPDHIYVIPPDRNIVVEKNILKLIPRQRQGLNLAIDDFFTSLATYKKSNAVGLLLSGTGSDGTQGLRAIREMGGITFAQDDSAEFPQMPNSARAAGVVDYVLSPADIAAQLVKISKGLSVKNAESAPEDGATFETEDKDLAKILQFLLASSDVDFTYYKPGTIKRRITRRMLLNDSKNFRQYADYLKKYPKEIDALYQDILIKVTDFFRDKHVFDFLKGKILPELFDRNPRSIRVWVPGCSTGEEVYSLAITLANFMEERHVNIPVQIFGTDISEAVLQKARRGVYPKSIETSVPPQLLHAYFRKVEGGYEILKSIRIMCIFAKHNMVKDIPFSKMDIVSCRNVLIYLDSLLQKKAFPIFHYALNPGGFLILGTAETAASFQDLYSTVDKEQKIYSKKEAPPEHVSIFSGMQRANPALREKSSTTHTPHVGKIDIEKEADRIVLSSHASAGIIVNDDLVVVQFRGDVGRYLSPASGRATLDLIKMVHKGLLAKILQMLAKTRKNGSPVRDTYVSMDVELEITSLDTEKVDQKCYLILFKDGSKQHHARRGQQDVHKTEEVGHIENELNATIDQLQSLVEARDAANEALRSAHEEVMSSNEELQSTNEELETTKEELQSTNEELMTLNSELQNRNAELKITEEAHKTMVPKLAERTEELFRKDEFISILGHELRNPLSPILYSLELVKLHGVADPKLAEMISVIERQAKIMGALIKSLLDSARAMGGKIKLELASTDFDSVVRHAIETAKPLIETGGHTLEVHPLDAPIRLLVDPMRLEQIIVNLLNNAAKYTKSGGHITVTTSKKGDDVFLSVKDNGIGISEEMLPNIFDYFAQENQTFSNFKGGLGIGLTLARTLTELHGGSLTASSPGLGMGSEFVLQLPARPAADRSGSGTGSSVLDAGAYKKRRIVVVDDNVALADVFAKLLRHLNHDVTVVYSGASAIEAARNTMPDIMFIDVAMPEMSGYELVQILRKDPILNNTKFIAVSGFGDEYSEKSQKAGFEDHLTKPVGIDALKRLLSK